MKNILKRYEFQDEMSDETLAEMMAILAVVGAWGFAFINLMTLVNA